MEAIFEFGKYKGLAVDAVAGADPYYLWYISERGGSSWKFKKWFIAQHPVVHSAVNEYVQSEDLQCPNTTKQSFIRELLKWF
jgi:hypothetical protein